MNDKPMLSLKDLIAQTPGAQTREQAIASIKARRERWLAPPPPPPEPEFAAPEPMQILDNPDAFAAGFWDRLKAKEAPTAPEEPDITHREPAPNIVDDPEIGGVRFSEKNEPLPEPPPPPKSAKKRMPKGDSNAAPKSKRPKGTKNAATPAGAKPPIGRRPRVKELRPEHQRFSVIDGGLEEDKTK